MESLERKIEQMTDAQFEQWFAEEEAKRDQRYAESIGITVEEWHLRIEACKHEGRMQALHQVDALMAAGWLIQIPSHESSAEPWQLQWRRPARRKGSNGMLFLSTNQAFNALNRETK